LRGLWTDGEEVGRFEVAEMKLGLVAGSSLRTTREVVKVRTDWRRMRRSIVAVRDGGGCEQMGVRQG